MWPFSLWSQEVQEQDLDPAVPSIDDARKTFQAGSEGSAGGMSQTRAHRSIRADSPAPLNPTMDTGSLLDAAIITAEGTTYSQLAESGDPDSFEGGLVVEQRPPIGPEANPTVSNPSLREDKDAEGRSRDKPGRERRFEAWKTFTEQHGQVLRKRIRADEMRQEARLERQTLGPWLDHFEARANKEFEELPEWLTDELQALRQLLSNIELTDAEVDQAEDKLVQAESAIRETLPTILGSEAEETFSVLEDNDMLFPVVKSPTSGSTEGNLPDPGTEESPEYKLYISKLDAVNTIEDQLTDLWDDARRLRSGNHSQSEDEASQFLQQYDINNNRLQKELRRARAELDRIRDDLQPLFLAEGVANIHDYHQT